MANTPNFGGGLLAGVRRSGVTSPSASIAAPGDPSAASGYNPQLGFLDQLKTFDPTAYSQIIAQGAGPTNPFSNYTLGDYRAPTAQSLGAGGARFNGQLSQHYDANGNRIDAIGDPFDINAYGSGLWAQGFDPKSPATPAALWDQYQKDSASNTDFQQYASPEISKHGWDPNTKQGLSDIYNNYYGYLAHRMGKAPDNLLSGPLGTILDVASIATGNPWLAAVTNGVTGGVNSGDALGGLLGAAGGYFGAGSVANAGGVSGIFNSLTDPALSSINGLFPASANTLRAGAGGGSMGLGSFFGTLGTDISTGIGNLFSSNPLSALDSVGQLGSDIGGGISSLFSGNPLSTANSALGLGNALFGSGQSGGALGGLAGLLQSGLGIYGAAQGINGLANGKSPPNLYQPKFQGQVDQSVFDSLNGQQGVAGIGANSGIQGSLPQWWNAAVNNPYYGQAQSGANQASQQGFQQANNLGQYGQQLAGAGQATLNSAFDPQNALYDRTHQQMTDQVRSALAARGLNSSGAGAGIENDALSNFNIDWQNNQLNRQIQGGNSARQLYGQSSNISQAIPGMTYNAGQYPSLPWQQNNENINTANSNFLGSLGGLQGLYQNPTAQGLSYLGYAGGQQGTAASQGYLNQQNSFNQIGQGLSRLQNLPQIFQPQQQQNNGQGGTPYGF